MVRARERQHPRGALRRSLKRPSGFAPACSVGSQLANGRTKLRKRQQGVVVAAQLPARADAAPFVGVFTPTCTGVTPAAVRSGRVYVRRGGWRAAVRSAWNGPRSSA